MVTWRPRLGLVCIQVLYIVSSLSLGKGNNDLGFIVGENGIDEDSIIEPAGEELSLGCGYSELVSSVTLYRINGNQPTVLHTTPVHPPVFKYSYFRSYTETDPYGCKMYQCEGIVSGTQNTVELTIDFGGCPTEPTEPTEPTNPTSSTSSTSATSSTSSGTSSPTGSGTTSSTGSSNSSKKFTGLKPLIFTVASVILLGTLAIVAIITCWIRARRSFNNRQIRPNNTPQDYLDYINDNEFTPLTTSEFLASLQERPPTYHQSEEMVQSGAQAGTAASTGQASQPTAASSSRGEGEESRPPAPASSSSREGAGSQAERGRGRPRRARIEQNTTAAEGAGSEGRDPTNQQGTSDSGEQGGSSDPRGPVSEQEQHTSPHTDGNADTDRTRVAILVDLELPAEGLSQTGSPFTATQEQIEEIEARVRTLESLAPPRPSPGFSSPALSAGSTGFVGDNSTNPFT